MNESAEQSVLIPNFALDGVDHINIYSKGRTRLGRLCSNHADIAVDHPKYGGFRTMEGLWYFLRTGMKHDLLRMLSGYDARVKGRELEKVWNENFTLEFKMGLAAKVRDCPELQTLLKDSDLPFVHYYCYGKGENCKVIVPKGHEWQIAFWERLRHCLKADKDINHVINSLMSRCQ